MVQISDRKTRDSVKTHLRKRVLRHGGSMEEDARQTLDSVVKNRVKSKSGLGSRISARFAGIGLAEDLPEFRGAWVWPTNFDK
ncbi:MAG: hypothetical protein ACKVQK_09930 [Burkholderiales bacterium]